MKDIVKKYIELQDEWSEAIQNGNEELYNTLSLQGKKLTESFNQENWDDLIRNTPNIQAKLFYKRMSEQKENQSEFEDCKYIATKGNKMTKNELVQKLGAELYFYQTEWNGYKVYGLDFGKDASVGLPMFILEKDSEVRLTTEKEAFDILDTL